MKTLSKALMLTPILGLGIMMFGCDEGVNNPQQTYEYGSVMFIHSAASTGEIDFTYLSLDQPNYEYIYQGAVYGGQYGYYYFVRGSRTFQVYLTNTNIAVANVTILLEEDQKQTVIAVDLEATLNPELLAFEDTLAIPESGKTFLRFIHASADAPDLDIHTPEDSTLVTNLSRYQASGYLELEAKTYEFGIFLANSTEQLITLNPMTLISQNNYTVILSGSIDGLPGPAFNGKIYQETSF